jgi:hypothetical protein
MRNKNLKYLFGILLSSVLLTVGCGSSSSNNPVSNGSVNSGLVSVSGNVKNADGKGTVSFYTPTAIYGNNMTNGISRAVVNNEIYTFNIDEKGNYAGQIPAGDYYIIAQNSDGSMKYASARKSISLESTFSEDNISSSESVDIPEIELVPTVDIKGYLDFETSITDESQLPFVYIEGMPFAKKTTFVDGEISFTLESVPLTDSYIICSDIWENNTRYHLSTTYSDFSKQAVLSNIEPISISGNNIKIQLVVKEETTTTPSAEKSLLVLTNNEAFPVLTDSDGYFVLPINDKNEIVSIIILDSKLTSSDVFKSSDITGESGNYTITIIPE